MAKEKQAKRKLKKRHRLLGLSLALLLGAALCFGLMAYLGTILESQKAAKRWQGDSDTDYAQVSAFLAEDEKISLEQVYTFRYAFIKALQEASLDPTGSEQLWVDCWSTEGKQKVYSALGSGSASVIAVGGDYFRFHPLKLLSGSYITPEDLMQDRVVLDEELAWLLFGSSEVQGLPMQIEGKQFMVAGVIAREEDFASRRAYTAGRGLYMSYEAFQELNADAGISCYELVMAEPVRGFVRSTAESSFPIGSGLLQDNTYRFGFEELLGVIGQFGSRSMQHAGVQLPYWENAARCVEDWCALLLTLGFLLAAFPVCRALYVCIRTLVIGKRRLEEEWIPELTDRVREDWKAARRGEKREKSEKQKKKRKEKAPAAEPPREETEAGENDW